MLGGTPVRGKLSRTSCEGAATMARLDELDTAILREMQADARRTNRDIAAAVGIPPTTALDRTRRLRPRGINRGALLVLHLHAIARPVQARRAVRIRPPSRDVI